jgi:putative addiction module killer protein
MIEVRQTAVFRDWLDGLKDVRAAERIAQRIVRLQAGLLGDVKPVGVACRNCGSIMVRDTGFISRNASA